MLKSNLRTRYIKEIGRAFIYNPSTGFLHEFNRESFLVFCLLERYKDKESAAYHFYEVSNLKGISPLKAELFFNQIFRQLEEKSFFEERYNE